MRSNSTGKMFMSPTAATGHGYGSNLPLKPKLFVKSSAPMDSTAIRGSKNKLLRYAKNLGQGVNVNMAGYRDMLQNKWASTACRSSRSLTTSPLFNIRYKSLNNLHIVGPLARMHESNGTLDSSNSGGPSSGGSGSGDAVNERCMIGSSRRQRSIQRPLSLSNLFWDLNPSPIRPGKTECMAPPSAAILLNNNNNNNSLPSGGCKPQDHEYFGYLNSKRLGTLYL